MALAPATVQRMPACLSRAPICLRPASTTPEEIAQALGAELRIAHPAPVPEQVVNALLRFGRGLDMDAQRGDEGAEPAGVQLGPPVPAAHRPAKSVPGPQMALATSHRCCLAW